jgi:hypothetical protein
VAKIIIMFLRKYGFTKGTKMLKQHGFSGVDIGKASASMIKKGGAPFKEALRKSTPSKSLMKALDKQGPRITKGHWEKFKPLTKLPRGASWSPRIARETLSKFRPPAEARRDKWTMRATKLNPGLASNLKKLRREALPEFRPPVGASRGRMRAAKLSPDFAKRVASMRSLRVNALNKRVYDFQQWALKMGRVITPDQARRAIKMGAAGAAGGLAGYGLAGGFEGEQPPPETY